MFSALVARNMVSSSGFSFLLVKGLLELVLKVGQGAQAFDDHHGAPALGVIRQKAVHLVDFHVGKALGLGGPAQQLHALLHGKAGVLTRDLVCPQ